MLVLSRFKGEQIVIGDGPDKIIVTVYKINGSRRVQLGIDAPREMVVHRGETTRGNDER